MFRPGTFCGRCTSVPDMKLTKLEEFATEESVQNIFWDFEKPQAQRYCYKGTVL